MILTMRIVVLVLFLTGALAFSQDACPSILRNLRAQGAPADDSRYFVGDFHFTIKNVWDKTLTKLVLTFTSLDSVRKQTQTDNIVIDVKFKPGQQKDFEWTTKTYYSEGAEAKTKFEVTSATFGDGTTWNGADHPECDSTTSSKGNKR